MVFRNMKKIYLILLALAVVFIVVIIFAGTARADTSGGLIVPQGGTGRSDFSNNSIITSGSSSLRLTSTSSDPLYVGSLFATSTTATSTISGHLQVDGNLEVGVVGFSYTEFVAPFLTATSTTQDSNFHNDTLVIDSSTGRVGIGTASPSAELHIGGTTPQMTIGDAGEEDTALVYDGNAQDFYIGLDDGTDSLIIGLGATVGTNPAITIVGDGTEDVTLAGDLTVSGTGPHVIGGALDGRFGFFVTGAYTSDGSSNSAAGTVLGQTITGAVGDITNLAVARISGAVVTQGTDTNISSISTLRVEEPAITNNLASSGKPDIAATLHIVNAPTEGDTNYALIVDDGTSRFDGNVGIGSTTPSSQLSINQTDNVPAFMLTNTGTDFTVYIEDIANDTSPFVIDASGNTLFGGNADLNGNNLIIDVNGDTTIDDGGGDDIIRFVLGGTDGIRIREAGGGSSVEMGIGDTSPDAPLEIVDDGGNVFLISSTADADGDFLTVDTSGNVGIGTTSPQENLHISSTAPTLEIEKRTTGGGGSVDSLLKLTQSRTGASGIQTGSGSRIDFSFESTNGVEDIYAAIDAVVDDRTDGSEEGSLRFSTILNNSLSEQLRITAAGNVGIGTSTPATLLDIFSTATTTATLDTNSATQGGCLKMRDHDGLGYTYITTLNGVLIASTVSCE